MPVALRCDIKYNVLLTQSEKKKSLSLSNFQKMAFRKVIQLQYFKSFHNIKVLTDTSYCFCDCVKSSFSRFLSQSIKYSTASTIYALSSGIILYDNKPTRRNSICILVTYDSTYIVYLEV
jgi:hypothetical protein